MVAELPKTTEENTGAHKPRQRRPKERSSKKQHKKKKGSEGGDQPQFMSKGAFQYLQSLMGVCDKPFFGWIVFRGILVPAHFENHMDPSEDDVLMLVDDQGRSGF